MLWMPVAILGYFLGALANILDKYILSAKIPSPAVYAFYVALFAIFGLLLAPFGLHLVDGYVFFLSLLSGIFYVYSLVFFYYAIRASVISRVAPLMGAMMSIFALIYSFVINVASHGLFFTLADQKFNLLAFFLLVIGGFLITFDIPFRIRDIYTDTKHVFLASAFMIISVIIVKQIYGIEGFLNGFEWSRIGLALGGFSLFAIPSFRKQIMQSFQKKSKRSKKKADSSVKMWFVLNKIVGATGNICVQYAISLGPLVLVQALSGVQFAFVFLIAMLLASHFPKLFSEKLALNDWVQKIVALACIGFGVYISTIHGVTLLAM